MEESNQREEQLLKQPTTCLSSEKPKSFVRSSPIDHPLLDLNLSMSNGTMWPSAEDESNIYAKKLQQLKQHTAEQIRLTAVEKAYVERTRELTRRELELAKKEFARARQVWERAREELEKVEKMKEVAVRRISSNCMEVTCHSCHQRFQT